MLAMTNLITLAATGNELLLSRVVPVVNRPLEIRLAPDAKLTGRATLRVAANDETLLTTPVELAHGKSPTWSFTPKATGYHTATIEFDGGAEPITRRFPVVWRDLYFLVWPPPEPSERLAYGPLVAQVIDTDHKADVIRQWHDHGADVVPWVGVPASDASGAISEKAIADWVEGVAEHVKRGCEGIFIDEFGAYPNPHGFERMRTICLMLKQLRARFPKLLIMPATAGAIQRELAIGYKEVGAVALFESYPTCFTRFFATHNIDSHLAQRIETARHTDLIHHADQPQSAIILLGTRVIAAHEEPVVAEIEQYVRHIKKTAPEMPGIGFYGMRYDGMTAELVRMTDAYYIKPVVDLRAIRFAPYTAVSGRPVDILVGIHNLGGMAARNVKVHVFAAPFGGGQKREIGTITVAEIGNGHMELTQQAEGELIEYQEVNGNRYAVCPYDGQNVVFLARTTGKVSWTPEKRGYYTITAEVQPSPDRQYTILDGAMQETLLVE